MADYSLNKDIAGKPAYLWIAGGVVVAYGAYWFINRNKTQNTATDQTAGYAATAYQTGSSGGEGLATYDGIGTPGSIGITAPVALPPGTVITIPGGNTQTPVTKVPVKTPKVTQTPPAKTVTAGKKQVTTVHKRGYTQAQLEAAQLRKAQNEIKTTKPPAKPPAIRPPVPPVRTFSA